MNCLRGGFVRKLLVVDCRKFINAGLVLRFLETPLTLISLLDTFIFINK
jgi:hypothetical protein